jgi:hypothetical protein
LANVFDGSMDFVEVFYFFFLPFALVRPLYAGMLAYPVVGPTVTDGIQVWGVNAVSAGHVRGTSVGDLMEQDFASGIEHVKEPFKDRLPSFSDAVGAIKKSIGSPVRK